MSNAEGGPDQPTIDALLAGLSSIAMATIGPQPVSDTEPPIDPNQIVSLRFNSEAQARQMFAALVDMAKARPPRLAEIEKIDFRSARIIPLPSADEE